MDFHRYVRQIVSTFKIAAEGKARHEYERILLNAFLHETLPFVGLKRCSNSEDCFMVTSFPERLF